MIWIQTIWILKVKDYAICQNLPCKLIVVWGSDTNIYIIQFTCSHGNKCAGVIAGQRGNDLCGTGVAYEANIAGNSITPIH